MTEPGQFLTSSTRTYHLCSEKLGNIHPVFAAFVEDSSQVNLETMGYFHQDFPDEIATNCPLCFQRIQIYVLVKSVTGAMVICLYCPNCDLLFRERWYGDVDEVGNFQRRIDA